MLGRLQHADLSRAYPPIGAGEDHRRRAAYTQLPEVHSTKIVGFDPEPVR